MTITLAKGGHLRAIGCSSTMSPAESDELLRDRIKFKFYCVQQHIDRLITFKQKGERYNQDPVARIRWEDETECVLVHLIGALDALLFRIKENLNIDVKPRNIRLDVINQKLARTKYKDLLSDALTANEETGWLYCLIKLRNIGRHRKFLNLRVDMGYNIPKVSFIISPNLEVIEYLSESVQRMRSLIQSIIAKEPKLKNPRDL